MQQRLRGAGCGAGATSRSPDQEATEWRASFRRSPALHNFVRWCDIACYRRRSCSAAAFEAASARRGHTCWIAHAAACGAIRIHGTAAATFTRSSPPIRALRRLADAAWPGGRGVPSSWSKAMPDSAEASRFRSVRFERRRRLRRWARLRQASASLWRASRWPWRHRGMPAARRQHGCRYLRQRMPRRTSSRRRTRCATTRCRMRRSRCCAEPIAGHEPGPLSVQRARFFARLAHTTAAQPLLPYACVDKAQAHAICRAVVRASSPPLSPREQLLPPTPTKTRRTRGFRSMRWRWQWKRQA